MDIAYIRALGAKDKEEEEEKPAPNGYGEEVSSRPLTPALFDALFGSNDNRRK
jgi:hypothetical protein